SVSEIFVTLLAGAALHLARPEQLLPGPDFISLLREQAITTVTLPPSLLSALPAEELPALRTLVCAGETCTREVVQRWSAQGRRLINAYGPTEATVCATLTDELKGEEKPPIGRPIGNVRVYVLDKQQRPVPVGVVGELYIGGMGVARGYQNRAEMSAEKFIPDAYSEEGGERLYRTGDWVRYVKGGKLEYVGRIDEQVKVRGFRIELGEIEAALAAHEAVREAAVVVKEDSSGDKRLAAYVVGREPGAPTAGELRLFIKDKLPGHMIPALFVTLDEMPLTPNGKIDRRALARLKVERTEVQANLVMPRTEAERTIAGIWQEVLQLESVGVHDNFFDLGGHSLLLIQLQGKLKEALGPGITIIDLFEHPTIAALSEELSRKRSEAPALQNSYDHAANRRALSQQNRRNRQRHQAV
ncbi:MAG TPA: non-ribosomal peptide synthetase, partial [Pyrinomonadaceae bacterium]